jgi:hypothetical protein
MEKEEIIADLRTALREFSKPEDLDPQNNSPTLLMDRKGMKAVCFRRGDFVPSGGSQIANLIRAFEEGDPEALVTVRRLVEQAGLEIKRNGEGRMITHIVLFYKGNIFQVLGLQNS